MVAVNSLNFPTRPSGEVETVEVSETALGDEKHISAVTSQPVFDKRKMFNVKIRLIGCHSFDCGIPPQPV